MNIKVGIIGGSGYTGVELLRILHQHPNAEVTAITSRSLQGKKISEVFPNMAGISDLVYSLPDDTALFDCNIVFFATPHGVAMNSSESFLDKGIKVIDLGADFRINDAGLWSQWYNMEHSQSALLEEAVYGQPEIRRDVIKEARLIANPGCYSTAVLLALKLSDASHRSMAWFAIRPAPLAPDLQSAMIFEVSIKWFSKSGFKARRTAVG